MKYKNIIVFQEYGRWYADYSENGKRFALHRASTKTRNQALILAKEQVDYMNK